MTVTATTEQNNSREDEQGGVSIVCFNNTVFEKTTLQILTQRVGGEKKSIDEDLVMLRAT